MAAPRTATRSLIEPTESGQRPRVRNRRALSRLPVEIPAILIWDDVPRDAVVTDLGMGGLFAECAQQVAFAASVIVVVEHGNGALRLSATVRWNSDRGMGMQFGLLGARETHAVAELVKQALASSE